MPIFVVGCYRSGTTMVERMLRSHPRITGPGFETQAFSRLVYGRSPDHPREHARYAGAAVDGPGAFERFQQAVEADVEQAAATHWVEKTPDHVFHVDGMMRRYAQARFVHVLRDGRDVVTSLLAFPSIVPSARSRFSRLVAGCALWEWMVVQALRAHRAHAAGGRFTTVRYEDFVRAPHERLRSLLEWADVAPSPGDLAVTDRALRAVASNSSYEPDAVGVYRSAVGRSTDRTKLSPDERALIEWLIGPTLKLAGYPPNHPLAVPRRVRARASAGKLFWLGARLARFRANVGYWPPPHIEEIGRRAIRPLLIRPLGAVP